MEGKQTGAETLSEESIEELDEETIKTKGGAVITDEDDSDDKTDPDQDGDDDSSEEGDTDDDSDEDTDVSKGSGETKKNKAEVKEGTDPFGDLVNTDSSETGGAKTSKLKVGMGRKDGSVYKLPATPTTGKQDDNGDNARLKSGLGKKDTGGKISDGETGTDETNADSARNLSGTPEQKGAAKNPIGEHMEALFAGEELSEEFQSKAATIFEAAVQAVAQEHIDTLQEEYAQEILRLEEEQQQLVEAAVEEVRDNLVDQVDGFLNFVVEQWVEENQVALESGMKVELVNGFIDGLKTLFSEHYVDIPEDKLDVIEEQSAEIDALSETTNILASQVDDLETELVSLKSQLVFESVSDELTDMQAEKFLELVENVEFTTVEEYTEKLETLKESYFPQSRSSNSINETVSETSPVETTKVMDSYVDAVAKNLKFR